MADMHALMDCRRAGHVDVSSIERSCARLNFADGCGVTQTDAHVQQRQSGKCVLDARLQTI
ncbi:hypothetical protein C9382_26100 [Pseudomonas aylmerensis]|uniref:Uncharacterized protein n=1 Tax=Pseudomonas aylmerensis TaxID=1869229 RepID=A0A2T4FME1_9PSED|nr:hypothetical protein DXV65_14465 [Pseudomonas fluorescens]OCW25454.1 hypothetical protein BBG20_16090 [Pseudomonas aylmerensis]PTC24528.1 hypothetical protein C9382_26100 [Pseudomonas aylmerensis]